MRAIWSGLLSAVVVCLYGLAIAAGEIEPLTPAEFENLQSDLKAAKATPAEGKKPKPPKPDRHDRRHPVDPVTPEPGPDVRPIQPVGPRPDNSFHPAPPRPQPKPDGKVIDNLIHNVPKPRPLAWVWGMAARVFWLIFSLIVLATIGVVLLGRAALRWFR